MSTTKHALIGLLLHRPAYPYDLQNRLEGLMGPSWSVNSGQISQDIRSLVQDGLVERKLNADGQAELPQKERHVYEVTASGAQTFEEWFEGPNSLARPARRPLSVKITFAGPERLEAAIGQIKAYEAECDSRLTELCRLRDEIPPDDEIPVRADHILLRVNLNADIFQLEGELRWARHAHEIVSTLLQREAIWPSASGRSDSDKERLTTREEMFDQWKAKNIPNAGDEEGHDG